MLTLETSRLWLSRDGRTDREADGLKISLRRARKESMSNHSMRMFYYIT